MCETRIKRTKRAGFFMAGRRVLLTLDLIVHGAAAEVPGILRDLWHDTPTVLPEVADALPALYRARAASAASRGGVVALSIAEQPVNMERPDQPGLSGLAYQVSVIGVLSIDPVDGMDPAPEKIKEDTERFARYVFQLGDDEYHGRPAPEIAGSRVTALKAEVER